MYERNPAIICAAEFYAQLTIFNSASFRTRAMTTPAQRERTQLRTKLYTGRQIPSKGRGGGDIDESDLLQMWPK